MAAAAGTEVQAAERAERAEGAERAEARAARAAAAMVIATEVATAVRGATVVAWVAAREQLE